MSHLPTVTTLTDSQELTIYNLVRFNHEPIDVQLIMMYAQTTLKVNFHPTFDWMESFIQRYKLSTKYLRDPISMHIDDAEHIMIALYRDMVIRPSRHDILRYYYPIVKRPVQMTANWLAWFQAHYDNYIHPRTRSGEILPVVQQQHHQEPVKYDSYEPIPIEQDDILFRDDEVVLAQFLGEL